MCFLLMGCDIIFLQLQLTRCDVCQHMNRKLTTWHTTAKSNTGEESLAHDWYRLCGSDISSSY